MTTYEQSVPGRRMERRPTCGEQRALREFVRSGIVGMVCLVCGLGLGVTHRGDGRMMGFSVALLLVGLMFAAAMERARIQMQMRMRGGRRRGQHGI